MDAYRIYSTNIVATVRPEERFVVKRAETESRLHCITTGSVVVQILQQTYKGQLGHTCKDEQGREYTALFSGE